MSNLPATKAQAFEAALIQGDLSRLTEKECISYYNAVCESVGLNPLTKPFEYLFLNGRKILYAKKDATDQLRKINNVSITNIQSVIEDSLLTVTVFGQDATGRTDSEIGVVDVSNLRGEKLANAKMKAVTKAKRRLTLSISGLGLLDETEIEDIPREAKAANFNNDPFGKKEREAEQVPHPEITNDEIPEDAPQIESKSNDVGEYVAKVGRVKGKALKDLTEEAIRGALDWAAANNPSSSDWKEFVEQATRFLK